MIQTGFSNPFSHSIEIKIDQKIAERLHFRYLPDYALFLKKSRIPELAREQFRLSSQLNIPMLSYFTHLSTAQLMEFAARGLEKLLEALANNQAVEYIERSVLDWVNNRIPEISRNQVSPEDISLLSFIRCKLFRDSLPLYTQDLNLYIFVMEEVTLFMSALDTISIKTLLSIQQELSEQAQQIAHIGNWSLDLATNSIVWSNELFRIYELEPQKHMTHDLTTFNHPDDIDYVIEQMRISRETGQPTDFYYRILLKKGKVKYLHARGQVVMDDNGKAEKMFGTLQDVTDQKKIERDHRENEHFIQKITELTPSLITVYNINTGKYLFINKAIQQLGYTKEEALDKGVQFIADIMHPDDLSRITSENNEAIEHANQKNDFSSPDDILEFQYRIRHANGHYRWFRTFGTVFERNAKNQVETVINISIDVTEQIALEKMLRQNAAEIQKQQDRYYKMIDEVKDYAILLLSPEGIIENWNSGAERIKGYTSEEIVGKNFRIFYPPEDRKNEIPEMLIREATLNGKASHEGWRVRKDQTRFWGNIVITALHDKDGNIIGFSKVTRDLTQKKLAEDNLRAYTTSLELKNQELDQKNMELESFSYIASHDLQEPVRKIRIWASRIEETEVISDNIKDTLTRIQRACVRMQELIRGVLQYSHTDMSKVPRELTDLDLVMEEVMSDLSDVIEEKKIEIEMGHLPTLNLVRLQFVQLFSNIISNAIKYRREDIPLKIKITSALLMEENGSPGSKKAFYKITISDNGIGFMQEYSDRMFELFRRLESGATYSGTGIGLAICKKIVKNHQGTITATGQPGKGSSFEIKLPVDEVFQYNQED
jgi:PAS domain S-box-containing protein